MNHKGFSILEMMIIVAIVGILSAIAIPNFQVWVANQRLRNSVAQLEGDLQVARITAINRNVPVTVLFNQGAGSYTVFVDDGTGGGTARNLAREAGEVLLFQRSLDSGVTFSAISMLNSAVLFNGKGLRWRPIADPASATLRSSQGKQYCVTITLVGDVNVALC